MSLQQRIRLTLFLLAYHQLPDVRNNPVRDLFLILFVSAAYFLIVLDNFFLRAL